MLPEHAGWLTSVYIDAYRLHNVPRIIPPIEQNIYWHFCHFCHSECQLCLSTQTDLRPGRQIRLDVKLNDLAQPAGGKC